MLLHNIESLVLILASATVIAKNLVSMIDIIRGWKKKED